jgi:hypothetical protein
MASPSLLVCFFFFFFFVLFFSLHLAPSSSSSAAPLASNFNDNFMVSWAPRNVKFLGSGDSLQLLLDQNTGACARVRACVRACVPAGVNRVLAMRIRSSSVRACVRGLA